MNRPLTSQQQLVYDFIREKIVGRGYGPTVREIGEHMNIKSPNGVMCHLRALERKGMIIRTANKSRAIELTEPIQRSTSSLPLGGIVHHGVCQLSRSETLAQADLAGLLEGSQKIALQVQDDSLLELNIRRGDLVVVEKQAHVRNGQLAVVQRMEAAGPVQLIRFVFQEAGQVRLQAANRSIPPTTLDQVDVVGVVLGVIRQFATS